MRRETVNEFLCFVRRECSKGCEACTFKEEKATTELNKKYCIFHYFDKLSDKSIQVALSKYRAYKERSY